MDEDVDDDASDGKLHLISRRAIANLANIYGRPVQLGGDHSPLQDTWTTLLWTTTTTTTTTISTM